MTNLFEKLCFIYSNFSNDSKAVDEKNKLYLFQWWIISVRTGQSMERMNEMILIETLVRVYIAMSTFKGNEIYPWDYFENEYNFECVLASAFGISSYVFCFLFTYFYRCYFYLITNACRLYAYRFKTEIFNENIVFFPLILSLWMTYCLFLLCFTFTHAQTTYIQKSRNEKRWRAVS